MHRFHPSTARLAMAAATAVSLLATAATAQATEGCALVEVQNVRPQQGYLMVSAFTDETSFGRKPVAALRLAAGEATMRFEVCGLSGPQVALMLYQDLDSDGKMGSNLLGLPTEPWGSSGSPGMMGPKWDTARVAVDGQPLVVRMSQ
jgi:uncharacterized protein (DUF2141 family)